MVGYAGALGHGVLPDFQSDELGLKPDLVDTIGKKTANFPISSQTN